MAQSTLSWLKKFQQQLGLKDENVAQIEQPIREPIEAKYYEKLKPQEQAEQHRQRELEECRKAADHPQREEQEKVEYENKLRRYEQEFTKAIQAEYPLSQSAVQRLKSFQQQLKLEDEDVDLIKQIIREPMESHVRIIRNSHSMGIEAIGNQIADWLLEEHQFSVGNKAWEDKKYVVFVNKSGFFRHISGLVYEYRIELSETDKSIAIAISEGDIRKQLAALALGSTMFTFPLLATAGLGIYSSGKFKEVIFSKIESLMQ